MSNRLLHGSCEIAAARRISASVDIAVVVFDECSVHRQSAGTVRIRLCGAIAVSDARFQLIVAEPGRRVDNLFKLLEIYVQNRVIYVVFHGKTE